MSLAGSGSLVGSASPVAEEKMEQGDTGKALEPHFLWGHPCGDPRRWWEYQSWVQAMGAAGLGVPSKF